MRGLLALTFAFAGISGVMAQQQFPPLPLDSAVVTGVLDNGLTYYIRHNDTPKGQADFYIAQKVGSILEEDHQRGLAHFLEHMCFNGTENFPGKGIINWLESIGVKFGYNLNAYTSVDETVYNISSVPVARESVQDSCLLILHDWSCALTLDPKEIDSERGVIHEEWRRTHVGTQRILERQLPAVYPDSRYGYRLPIGTMEVVDNFDPQAIVDYYHKWYRPDQQGIIVVGDIDPAYIEKKIKEIFSPIKMPENPAEREYFSVEDTPGTIFAIDKDAEVQAPIVLFMVKSDDALLPREYRNTALYFPTHYLTTMATMMLQNRLDDLQNKPETEYAQVGMDIGEFFLSKTKGAVTIQVVAKDTDVVPAFTQVYRELLRAVRGGFTVGEYERARAEFLSRIERAYENRNDVQSEAYSREIVRHFIDNEPMPGIAVEKQTYDQIANMITVEQINQLLPALINDDNRVLVAFLPDSEAFPVPTQEQFEAGIAAVEAEELETYKDEVRTDPLIPNLPKPGKIAKTAEDKTWGATVFTLGNGVKVVVKPTDFKANEIMFMANAVGGGLSEYTDVDAASVRYMPLAQMNRALNDYSNSDVNKYLQGKQASVSFSADDYMRALEGSTTVKDLPTLMELIYATFTGYNFKEDEFVANRDAMAGMLANQESNPQYIFQRDAMKSLFKVPYKQAITSADIKAADRQVIIDLIHKMMANAADYTFYFVGSIDMDTFKPLMEQYIATLPANPKKAVKTYTVNPDVEVIAGSGVNNFTTKMQTPQSWLLFAYSGEMPFTTENKLLANVASQVLSKRLLDKIREEMGATYSIGAQGDVSRISKTNAMFQVAAPVNPELKEKSIEEIKKIFVEATQNITPEEIKPAIEYLTKTNEEGKKQNEEWIGHMVATDINGVNVFMERGEVIPTITVEKVQNFIKQVLDQNNFRMVVLDAAAEE